MKLQHYTLLLITAITLFACNTGKHYFNKRIGHPGEKTMPAEQEPRVPGQTFLPLTSETVTAEPGMNREIINPAADKTLTPAFKRTHRADAQGVQASSIEKVLPAEKENVRPALHSNTSGNDKEGFILLLILAALLVGLGLLFFFLVPAVGLVLLIVFSIAAGIVLVLVLLALVF